MYKYKETSKRAINEVLEGLPATFTGTMNKALAKDITKRKLSIAVSSIAKGKAPGHDGIPIEFFQRIWLTIENDFHRMLTKGFKDEILQEGIIREGSYLMSDKQ